MARWNEEGVRREDLIWMLERPDLLRDRLARGRCFLCSGTPINAAALCDICMTMLSREELLLVEQITRSSFP